MTIIPGGCYSVRDISNLRQEDQMDFLIVLGDFLMGVGVLLIGLAALYYAYAKGSHGE